MDKSISSSLIFLFFALNLFPGCLTEQGCPLDLPYTTHMTSFRGKCYQYVSAEKKWKDARDYCWQNGGSLVTLNDEETNKFVTDTLSAISAWSNKAVWSGLNDRESSHYWRWVTADESVSIDMTWSNWGDGHPRTGMAAWSEGDCIRLKRNNGWKWDEASCDAFFRKHFFICEYEQEITTQFPVSPRFKVIPNLKEQSTNEFLTTESLAGLDPALYADSKNTSQLRRYFNHTVIAGLCLIIIVLCVFFAIYIIRKRRLDKKPPSYEETLYEDITLPNAATPLTMSGYKPSEPERCEFTDTREHRRSNMYIEPDVKVMCADDSHQKSAMTMSQTSTDGYVEPSKVMNLSQLSDTYLSPLSSPSHNKTIKETVKKPAMPQNHEYENTQSVQPRKLPDIPDYLPMGGSKGNVTHTNVPSVQVEHQSQKSEPNEQIYSEISL